MADGNMPPDDYAPSGYGRSQTDAGFGRKIQTSHGDTADRTHERPPRRRVRQDLLDAVPEPDGPVPTTWTPDHVGRRLIDAFRVLHRMPRIAGPKPFGNGWPSIVRDPDDLAGMSPDDRVEHLVRSAAKPTRLEMTRMETAFGWLAELRAHDAGMALQLMYWADAMARRRLLRDLCKSKGWAYSTFKVKLGRGRKWIAEQITTRADAIF